MRTGRLALTLLAAAHLSCEVPPLMSTSASITLIANPPFIVANGGVSVITALLTEPAGTLVPDGTVVFFFTNLGRVDSQAKTRDGVARVNLVADARSGTATVTAYSGGAVPSGATTAGTTTEVRIGSGQPVRTLVSANPSSVRGGGEVTIIANVFDERGNGVANVPVIFTITGGLANERLESGGGQRFTDNNGQAFDTLITRPVAVSKTVTVTATPAAGTAGEIGVQVNP